MKTTYLNLEKLLFITLLSVFLSAEKVSAAYDLYTIVPVSSNPATITLG